MHFIFNNHAIAEEKCFIASNNNKIIAENGNCNKRYPPCSTFKIAISLMGFDAKILIDETHPTWDFKLDYADWIEKMEKPT